LSYYYLVASLPSLVLGEPPPISSEAFVAEVENLLEPSDLTELVTIWEHRAEEGRSDFSRNWHQIDTQMRNAMARIRARRRGVDPGPYLRPHDNFRVYIDLAVMRAMEASDPLEAEREIDGIRWQWLEEAGARDPFGLPAVLSFAARLRIAERWAKMDGAAGMDRLESLIESSGEGALGALSPGSGSAGG
jgi:hypothetical protein